ncbi:MAG: endo-1,4-beta-xylanase [Treponema sp.]|nr:endo-1,4-beta-xylanase [Treponema sp.]
MWQVNTSDYPVIAEHTFENGTSEWISVSGSSKVGIGDVNFFYLSTYETTKENLTIYVDNFKLKVTYTNDGGLSEDKIWTNDSVASLKETYKDIFDSFGIACEYSPTGHPELSSSSVRTGLSKHADSITMGNEFKPQFIAAWWGSNPSISGTFTASNGKTIKTPKLNGFGTVDNCLQACKNSGLKMRGHVLVWHSQTEEAFFREDYKTSGNLVDSETMTARQEWYIKTVLEHIADWEAENGYGEGNHLVWAWDVVNEAMADDAGKTYTGSSQNWLRGSTSDTKDKAPSEGGSRWYQIYGSEEFIINAFRFANAYAPSDVKLCYNDYNEYMDYSGNHGSWKTSAILHLIEELQNDSGTTINGETVKARIDVMGMQSHVGPSWPGSSGYESALKRFLNAGLDVHVTEFDISATSQSEAASSYSDYFKMLKKYGKQYSGNNKITNVTVWGISSEDSWISKNGSQYPLLFTRSGTSYYTNSAFDAVIKAAQ